MRGSDFVSRSGAGGPAKNSNCKKEDGGRGRVVLAKNKRETTARERGELQTVVSRKSQRRCGRRREGKSEELGDGEKNGTVCVCALGSIRLHSIIILLHLTCGVVPTQGFLCVLFCFFSSSLSLSLLQPLTFRGDL